MTLPRACGLRRYCDFFRLLLDQGGGMMTFEGFEDFMGQNILRSDGLERLQDWVREIHGAGPLDDDFSIVRIHF